MTIYVMHATNGGPIKIGYAASPNLRRSQIAALFPYGVDVVATMPGEGIGETFLHQCFSPLRVAAGRESQDWFKSGPALWRFVIDVLDNGRPAYLPPERDLPVEEGAAMAERLFGSTEQAMVALGYSPSTTAYQMFRQSWNCGRGMTAKLLFRDALRKGALPDYIATLHGETPSAEKAA